MEVRSAVHVEVTIDNKTCVFIMPSDMSFGNAIDGAHKIYLKVIDMAYEAAKKESPMRKDDDASE